MQDERMRRRKSQVECDHRLLHGVCVCTVDNGLVRQKKAIDIRPSYDPRDVIETEGLDRGIICVPRKKNRAPLATTLRVAFYFFSPLASPTQSSHLEGK